MIFCLLNEWNTCVLYNLFFLLSQGWLSIILISKKKSIYTNLVISTTNTRTKVVHKNISQGFNSVRGSESKNSLNLTITEWSFPSYFILYFICVFIYCFNEKRFEKKIEEKVEILIKMWPFQPSMPLRSYFIQLKIVPSEGQQKWMC